MLEVSGLKKRFKVDSNTQANKGIRDVREDGRWFNAVNGVSFHCEPGQVLGLLGPNGAGKTTFLRMLSTALRADSGSICIGGEDVIADPLVMRRKLGFLSGSTGLYRRLTVRENVEYFGRLHAMSQSELTSEIERIFDLLDIHPFANKRADDLSTGMKQRANIARAVIHKPEVLILDEPTTGLDVMSAKTILNFIESYRGSQIPVVFSTHHLHEVERLCDRVTLIDQGETRFDGSLSDFETLDPSGDLYEVFVGLISAGRRFTNTANNEQI